MESYLKWKDSLKRSNLIWNKLVNNSRLLIHLGFVKEEWSLFLFDLSCVCFVVWLRYRYSDLPYKVSHDFWSLIIILYLDMIPLNLCYCPLDTWYNSSVILWHEYSDPLIIWRFIWYCNWMWKPFLIISWKCFEKNYFKMMFMSTMRYHFYMEFY